MREPVVDFPSPEDRFERRDALRIAARQIQRADLYLEAVANMGVLDRASERSLNEIRNGLLVLIASLKSRSQRVNT